MLVASLGLIDLALNTVLDIVDLVVDSYGKSSYNRGVRYLRRIEAAAGSIGHGRELMIFFEPVERT